MAESNATQVILTDDGIKIIKAQDTADNATSQASKADSAALIAQSKANAAKSAANSAYNYANSEIAVQSTATAKAQSKADDAFNQAQAVGKQASEEIAVQSTATAKAQSKADDAFSKATTAIDNGKVTSQAVTDLKDGSKLTIAELENGLATKVANSDYASYKEQTASQIGQLVTNGAFSAYQQTTADLISSKVATKDFSAYQATTAKAIESKVESKDFNTYKSQTANLINDKVSSAKYTSDKTQTDKDIASKVSSGDFNTYKQQTADLIAEKVATKDFSTYKSQTANLISQKVANKDFSAYQATTAKAISSKVESKDFNTYKTQTDGLIAEKVATKDFSTYKSQTADAINARVTKGDLIDEINMQAGNTLISSSGHLTLSGKNIYFDTKNPVIIPSANITGTLMGKELTAGTINGTTFNAGDIINDANNTSKLYPTTISSDGHIYTTRFNPVDAMQTDLSTGALTTKYRAINTTNPNNHYEAYDTTLQADQIALFAGYTNGKDMSFTQSVTGSNQDGYVLISPLNGLTLHGDNQQITFNGTSDDVKPKGVIITPYGNINPNGTQNIWYVGNNMNMKTASFGMDADQKFGINLSRQTFVDEIEAMGNRLPNGRLFLHAVDNDAQMYLLNDGKPAFVSPTIYNRTYSYGANMFITSSGRVGRSTSASKYKLAIARSDDTLQADRLMTLKPASWNDKVATEKMAESLSNGEIPVEAEINLKRHYGLIAEDLRDAGLDEFLITGKDGQIEGIEYDRLWTVLIPKIKQLNNRINELERKTL